MTNVLLTGISGFVGSHLLESILLQTDWEIVGLERSNLVGDLERISEVLKKSPNFSKRVKIIRHDLRDSLNGLVSKRIGEIDYVLHLGASSHVDRSIRDPISFLEDNVKGTVNLLEWARQQDLKKFLYFSTDEVYGPAPEGVSYKEEDRARPNNPYAASKAASESFCFAYHNTYGTPILITRAMNIIGKRQHPEKFLPLVINKIINREKLLIHSSPIEGPGKRHYIHTKDVSDACIGLLQKGSVNEVYNIVGEREVDNLEFAKEVAKNVEKWCCENNKDFYGLDYELVDFHSSRPGHDFRYSIEGEKLFEMGFEHSMTFEESIREIVYNYMENMEKWL